MFTVITTTEHRETVMNQPAENTVIAEVDLYREVHKGLRLALFELVEMAGTLDATDHDGLEEFGRLFGAVDMMLQTHHRHEDGAELVGLIAQHVSDVLPAITEAHDHAEQQLATLRCLVSELAGGVDRCGAIYDASVAFTAGYLDHMAVEETQVMPRLQAAASAEQLMAITMAIRMSVPPPDMCVFLRYMLPAMTPDERSETLGGMKAGAPPEIFELFWGVAEASLSPSALAAVADHIAA